MIHKSELGEHAERFPADSAGHVPEQGDDWRGMSFEHGPHDPDEKGISDEERQRRIEHLDQEWWPNVIAQVNEEICLSSNRPISCCRVIDLVLAVE